MPAFEPDIPRVRETVLALIDEYHLPGASVGIVQGEDLVHAEAFGWADIFAQKPMRPETRQRIGSITKTMVGLCVMRLTDDSRLSLDDRIVDLLRDIRFHGYADALTVRHLLTHTGGIGEAPNPDDLKKPFAFLFAETDPASPLAKLYADGITVEAPPGTKWAYANHGFALLGEIVSRLEGAPLADVMRRRVFQTLGMTASDLDDVPHPDLSHGYSQAPTPESRALLDAMGVELESDEPVDGHNLPGKFVRVWGNGGAGAVQSNVPDMARYASALLRSSRGIVRPETLAAMTSDQWRPDARLPGWGLGFAVRDAGGNRMFAHGGSVFGGWNSWLAVFPDLDAALVFHINVMHDAFDTIMLPRLRMAFLGLDEPGLPEIAVDPDVLETAPGVYELTEPGPLTNFRPKFYCGRVQIRSDDGALMIYSRRGVWKDGARLRPVDQAQPDLLAIDLLGPPRSNLVLIRDNAGRVTGLRFQTLHDMYRNPELEPWT